MALASTSLAQLRYALESVWGATPTTGSSTRLRMVSESLTYEYTKEESNEISPDRQTSSLGLMNASASGSINFELSYKEYDPFLAAVMMNNWTEYGTGGVGVDVAGAIDVSNAGYDMFTASTAPTGSSAFTSLKAGAYVKITSANPAIKNGFYQLTEDATATVLRVAKSGLASAAVAGATVKLATASLKVGNIKKSFSIEKQFSDVNQFWKFTGMMVSKMDLNLTDGSFLTGTFDFIGAKSSRSDATAMPVTNIDSQTFRSMSAVDGVRDIRIGGIPIKVKYDTYIKEMTLTVDNQLEGLTALGELGNVDVIAKKILIGGSISIYLSNGALYDDFIASATNNFSFILQDPDGNGYAFVFDRIDWGSMTVTAQGDGQSAMLEGEYKGLKGILSKNTLTIYRL